MNHIYHIIGSGSAIAGSISLRHNLKSDHLCFASTKQTEGRKVRDPARCKSSPFWFVVVSLVGCCKILSGRRLQGVAMRSAL
jgi:hypothetical protein